MNKNDLIAFGITILFLGVAVQPSVATIPPEEINVVSRDYLFQTLIDISNNPEIKNSIKQYKDNWKHNNEFINFDIDRNIYRKIFFKNPRLISQLILTKPSISKGYLDFVYNQGIKLINILGEDKVSEIIESVEIINIEVFNELNNIIKNDEEISSRIATLKELNKELKPDIPFIGNLIICIILLILLSILAIVTMIFYELFEIYPALHIIFYPIYYPLLLIFDWIILLGIKLECIPWPWWQ